MSINDLLKNETIYFRKSHLLRKPYNQQQKLFRKALIQDSLNEPSHPINSLIKNEEVFVPFLNERNSLGRLITKPFLSSNRDIKLQSLVKKHYTEPLSTNRSYGQKNKTQSTADSFQSFFTFHKSNTNFLLKHKNSEPLTKQSYYKL